MTNIDLEPLQYKSVPVVTPSPLKFILLAVGGGTVLIFLLTLIIVAWWNAYKRPLIKDTKIFNPGELPFILWFHCRW